MLNETVKILDIPIACLTREVALREIVSTYDTPGPSLVVYANAHTLNLATKDTAYRKVLLEADLVLNDGSGVALAARIHGRRFPENLNGSDLNPLLVETAAARGWPVFFLGGRSGVAERTAEILKNRFDALKVAGTADGYFTDEPAMVQSIRASGAGLLMVAMGNPLQELFLAEHLPATGVRLGIGVGAFFDFTAGVVPRSPVWMNKAGIEWVYRLKQEPRRMWRRYVLGNPAFLGRVVAERFRRSP